MAYSNFTKKQAGVIYRAVKEEKLFLSKAGITFLYNRADAYINRDVFLDDIESKLRHAVDEVFNGDYTKAQGHLDDAVFVYNTHFGGEI